MNVRLLFPDRVADPDRPLPGNAGDLEQDLALGTLLDAMAGDDAYLREQARLGLLTSLTDPDEIRYRQEVLRDCLQRPDVVRRLYDLAVDALASKRKTGHLWFRDTPEALVQKSVRILELLAGSLRELRDLAEAERAGVSSRGLTRLFATLEEQLGDDYLASVDAQLRELAFRRGVLVSARLGRGNRGTGYLIRKPNGRRLLDRLSPTRPASHSFTLPARDEHGLETLATIRNHGLIRAADALARSVDHILGFFAALRAEAGFYLACTNLHERLVERGLPTCFPEPRESGADAFACADLYDAPLVFHLEGQVVGNEVAADGKRLVLVTGANQGGKSTFLRSVGVAQLMLQAGMFAPAASFRANVVGGVYTHFKREEDASMTHGKLDEELARMSAIVDAMAPRSLLLCNESFASTNEREGSEIGRQLLAALLEVGVKVVFVTHLYDLADGLFRQELDGALFLRAGREPDGRRTFRLAEGRPLPTSYGDDSYRRIMGDPAETR